MTETATVPARRDGFLRDENGIPDEANLAFLVALVMLVFGALINTFTVKHFPLEEFAGAVCLLIPLYKATRGDFRKS